MFRVYANYNKQGFSSLVYFVVLKHGIIPFMLSVLLNGFFYSVDSLQLNIQRLASKQHVAISTDMFGRNCFWRLQIVKSVRNSCDDV